MEAQEWVNHLEVTRRARHKGKAVTDESEDVPAIGAETVGAAVHLMSQLFGMAMKETPPIVMANPFVGLELPVIRPHEIDFLEHDEAETLYTAAAEIGPRWRTLIELGTEVGLRPGELYGLHGHRVDWLRGKIQVIDVMTRAGLRRWPKSKKSHRVVPIPAHIMEGMSALMAGARATPWCSLPRKAARWTTGTSETASGTRPYRLRASAASRPGSCATPPQAGW